MNWYPWLNSPYSQIIALYQKGHGPRAFLLHSKKGNGEMNLCYAISRWLMCLNPEGIKNCNKCHSCRLMMARNHPDFYYLVPEKGEQILGIDKIRNTINKIYFYPYRAKRKLVWLPYSELLTEQAANALLKILEEPLLNDTFFLMGCQEPSCLLPTFRSRLFYWALSVPKESLGLGYLQYKGILDPQVACTALRLCSGAVQAAEELLQPTRWKERLALCKAMNNAINSGDMLLLLPTLNKDKDSAPVKWLLSILIDARKWQQGVEDCLVNVDMSQLIKTVASCWSAKLLHRQWQHWLNYRRQWNEISGMNCELILTNHLLSLEKDIYDISINY